MTMDNYREMSNQELLDIVFGLKVYVGKLNRFLSNHMPDLLDEIMCRTKFLDSNENIHARLFCIKHNIDVHPSCQGISNGDKCHNHVKWNRKTKQFKQFCCSKCAQNDKNVKEKRLATNRLKYDCDNPSQSKQVKDKIQYTKS